MLSDKSWRISLTQKCNYKCFFCHEEGFVMSEKRNLINVDVLYEMMLEGLRNGFDRFNFTGGEPLYERDVIITLLKKLENEGIAPAITIGTNGTMIDRKLLVALKAYPGEIKFNCSLHAIDDETYSKIIAINRSGLLPYVVKNLAKATKMGIPVKLNFVLLKGLNNHKEYIQKIFDFALENNINTLKFLELLITNKLMHLYDYYYEVEAIAAMFPNDLNLISDEIKRKVYRYKNTNLIVELQKCPCKIGCSSCQQVAGRMVTADGTYFPCFTLETEPISLIELSQNEAFRRGDMIIKKMGSKYKNGSPLIIQKAQYLKKRREYYYEFENKERDLLNWIKIAEENGVILRVKRTFKEFYFEPAITTERTGNNQLVFKFYQNTYNEFKFNHVLSSNIIKRDGNHVYTEVNYLSQEEEGIVDNYHEFINKLKEIGMEVHKELNWEIYFYDYKGITFSIGRNIESGKWTLLCETPFNGFEFGNFNIKNIKTDLHSFLEDNVTVAVAHTIDN